MRKETCFLTTVKLHVACNSSHRRKKRPRRKRIKWRVLSDTSSLINENVPFRYFVPYVHIGKFVETVFKGSDKKLPIMCIGITSGIGRLVFGYIADLPKVNRILLQQVNRSLLFNCLNKSFPETNFYKWKTNIYIYIHT